AAAAPARTAATAHRTRTRVTIRMATLLGGEGMGRECGNRRQVRSPGPTRRWVVRGQRLVAPLPPHPLPRRHPPKGIAPALIFPERLLPARIHRSAALAGRSEGSVARA